METAGKQVDDDSLRELMKENGIGRPSTRANIIETLFRRKYIERQKKRIVATATGVDLIGKINSDLLKSAELTGIWEKKLRDIEKGDLDTHTFKNELNQMVAELVRDVKLNRQKQQPPICPKCKKGVLATGNSAWGCMEYKNGCDFKIPFVYKGVTITPIEAGNLIKHGKTRAKYALGKDTSAEKQAIFLKDLF